MEIDTDWDVEKYFSPLEPSHHWNLRKEFLVKNKGRFNEERLVCLGQTFANIEFMGCKYPKPVMDLVEDMAYGIVQPFRELQKNRLKRTFISGAGAAEAKINKIKRTSDTANSNSTKISRSSTSLYGNFVKETNETPNAKSYGLFSRDSTEKSFSLTKVLKKEENQTSSIKHKPKKLFEDIGNTDVSYVNNEKQEELNVEEAINQLKNIKEHIKSLLTNNDDEQDEKDISMSEDNIQYDEAISFENELYPVDKLSQQSDIVQNDLPSFSEFIIVRLKYNMEQDPREVINQSAAFCKMAFTFNRSNSMMKMGPRLGAMIPKYQCAVCLEGNEIATGTGLTEKDAAIAACTKSLEILEQFCYTIVIKNKYCSGNDSFIDAITLETKDKNGKIVENSTPEQQTNIGHKLLKMMGWSKGGLGKDGQGIHEPIEDSGIIGREGFGWKGNSGTGQAFKLKIRKMLEEYAASDNPYDLVFTPDFTNEQRHEIHHQAERHNLKHKSYGKGNERFLTISRKFQKNVVINQLRKNGGSNKKYELINPKK